MTRTAAVVEFLTVAAALLWSTAPLLAAWPQDPTVNVPLCLETESQNTFANSSVSDGAGGMIVVWTDGRTGDTDLWAQRVGAEGEVLWAADGVPVCTVVGGQSDLRTVSDGAGGVIVVWRDRRSGDQDYYAQRINADGQILLPTTSPSLDGVPVCTSDEDQEDMESVADGAGGVIVVWEHNDPADTSVYAQRLDADGELMWPTGAPSETGVSVCDHQYGPRRPALALDGAGGVVVAWFESRNSSISNNDIYAQRLDLNGVGLWPTNGVPVCEAELGQIDAQIAGDGTGGAIIAWKDPRPPGTYYGLYGQRLNSVGGLVWPAEGVLITESFGGTEDTMTVVSDGVGGAYLVWNDTRDFGTNMQDIFAQRLNGLGQALWAASGIPVVAEPESQSSFDVVSKGPGGLVVSWSDHRGDFTDIYAQQLNGAGLPIGPIGGAVVSSAEISQNRPTMVDNGSGGVIIAWTDWRNYLTTGYDIYAQNAFDTGLIFADGFESGSTTAWSSVMP